MRILNLLDFIRVFGGSVFLLISFLTHGQSPLFQEVAPQLAGLAPEDQTLIQSSIRNFAVEQKILLKLNTSSSKIDSVKDIQLLADPISKAHWQSTTRRGEDNYTWFGALEDGTGIFLTVMNGKIAAKFYLGGVPCLLSPLGDSGYHILTKYNNHVVNEMTCGNAHYKHSHKPASPAQPQLAPPPVQNIDNINCNLRVLVVVTEDAEDEINFTGMNVQQFVQMAIDESNLAYMQSGTNNFQMELARIVRTNYEEENFFQNNDLIDLVRFQAGSGEFNTIPDLRNEYDTDIQILLRRGNDIGLFGQAFEVPTTNAPSADNAYCVVMVDGVTTGRFSFVHEVAHLQGCRHDNDNRTPNYARGFVFSDTFASLRTIMATAFETPCGSLTGCRVQFFSNPDVNFNSNTVGTSSRNNARRIRETASIVLNHRMTPNVLQVSNENVGQDLAANFLANTQVSTNGSVTLRPGSRSTMRASQRVILRPGFHARSGCTFRAYTQNNACNPLPELTQVAKNNSSLTLLPSLEKSLEESLQVAPNPNQGQFKLSFQIPPSDEDLGAIYLTLHNYRGEVIFSRLIEEEGEIEMDLSNYPKGMYLAKLQIGTYHSIVKKIIYE